MDYEERIAALEREIEYLKKALASAPPRYDVPYGPEPSLGSGQCACGRGGGWHRCPFVTSTNGDSWYGRYGGVLNVGG